MKGCSFHDGHRVLVVEDILWRTGEMMSCFVVQSVLGVGAELWWQRITRLLEREIRNRRRFQLSWLKSHRG